MRDTRKIGLLSLILVVVVFFIVFSIYLGLQSFSSKNKARIDSDTLLVNDSYSSEVTESYRSETSNTESEKQASSSEEQQTKELERFLEQYFTWSLTEESVQTRADDLELLMSQLCYEQQHILSDSEELVELIKKYEETKEINTSNSIQLVSSQYIDSQIYQDTTDPTLFFVKVQMEQQAPYQESGYLIKKEFHIRFSDGIITQMNEIK